MQVQLNQGRERVRDVKPGQYTTSTDLKFLINLNLLPNLLQSLLRKNHKLRRIKCIINLIRFPHPLESLMRLNHNFETFFDTGSFRLDE